MFGAEFQWLCKGFIRSIERNTDHDLDLIRIDMPDYPSGVPGTFVENSVKLHEWRMAIYRHEGRIVLMDCDTLVLGPLDGAFDEGFDIGLTVRPGPMRRNGGVVFVRCNQQSRGFFDEWCANNDELLKLGPNAQNAVGGDAGINQASLGRTLGASRNGTTIGELPCEIWNSVEQTWRQFSDKTKVVHVKGQLREYVMGKLRNVSQNWRDYYECVAPVCREYGLWHDPQT